MLKEALIAAVFATTALSPASADDATEKREKGCTTSQMKEVEKQIAETASVAKRTKADMYLSMSKVAKENDDTRGCLLHMEAIRELLGN